EDWGACDGKHGQRVRRRHIVQPKLGLGLDCEGTTSEVGACERKCQDRRYLCSWADWSAWGSCSTSCGPEGRLTRRRSLKVSGEAPQRALAAAPPAAARGSAAGTDELSAKYEALGPARGRLRRRGVEPCGHARARGAAVAARQPRRRRRRRRRGGLLPPDAACVSPGRVGGAAAALYLCMPCRVEGPALQGARLRGQRAPGAAGPLAM
ncbi:unnamed protein product, partial [Prorocentrum cordatum]